MKYFFKYLFLFNAISFFFFYQCNSFQLDEVSKNIFVHYGQQEDNSPVNKGDIANIGFIVGNKSIMVIDTGGSPRIGRMLLESIKKISKLPISHVVITHGHPDHFFGISAFDETDAEIVGHVRLDRSIASNFDFYKQMQISTTQDPSLKDAKQFFVDKSIKINEEIIINLGDREIIVKAWESGHTDNDLTIYDLKTKTLWTENVFNERVPSVRASITGWLDNLKALERLEIKKIVPGHGPVRSKEESLRPMINYFNRIIKEVRIFHNSNRTLFEAQKFIASQNEENWLLYEQYNASNVSKAFTELEWE